MCYVWPLCTLSRSGLFISSVLSTFSPQSLTRQPLSRRRQLLRENFVETEGEFVFATSLDTKDIEQIAEFLEQSVKGECNQISLRV